LIVMVVANKKPAAKETPRFPEAFFIAEIG